MIVSGSRIEDHAQHEKISASSSVGSELMQNIEVFVFANLRPGRAVSGTFSEFCIREDYVACPDKCEQEYEDGSVES